MDSVLSHWLGFMNPQQSFLPDSRTIVVIDKQAQQALQPNVQ
jgi:hypothetical protein